MMRPQILGLVLCSLGSLFICAPAISAEIPADELPDEFGEAWVLSDEVSTSPFHQQRFTDTYLERIKNGQIFEVTSEMISLFDALDWGDNEPKQQKILNQLQRFRGAVRVALETPGIEGPLDLKVEQDIFIEALNEQKFGLHSLQIEMTSDGIGDVSVYFKDTPDELLLYEWAEDEENVRQLLSTDQVRQWRLLENALSNLINDQVKLVSAANIMELKNAVERWENVLDKGYSMMPWESYLNGRWIDLPKRDFGPPDHQWIVLHPTLGLELSVDDLDESRIKETLHLEVLGHIWYQGRQLDDYKGISATISMREDLDPGLGILVHFKRNWNLGLAWHDVDEDPFLFFSVDLFKFAKQEIPKYVERYNGVRTMIKE